MKKVVVHTKEELKRLIRKNIEVFGNECNLNVTDMEYMFAYSKFNQDISSWKHRLNPKCELSNMFNNTVLENKSAF